MNAIVKNAAEFVEWLLSPLSSWHFYHNYDHAIEVMERAIYLAKHENVNPEEIEGLAIAALFHDTGFMVQYDENEIIWAKIAHNYLKTTGYDDDKIHSIEKLIMATDPAYKHPENILEKIIKDADLDNLGTSDFIRKWDLLLQELKIIKNINLDTHAWHLSALKLIENHQLYTKTQSDERNKWLNDNVVALKKLVQHENSNFIEIEL